jgi:hypothetical protein
MHVIHAGGKPMYSIYVLRRPLQTLCFPRLSALSGTFTCAYSRLELRITNYVFRVGRAQKDIILALRRRERERRYNVAL